MTRSAKTAGMKRSHSMPFGAQVQKDGSVRFRLWAPKAERVELRLEDHEQRTIALKSAGHGWFELVTPEAHAGSHYRFRIDEKSEVPDPASRFQPYDVHGPSEVVDPRGFEWKDDWWHGRPWEEAVIYELHVGAFSSEGSFAAVERKLEYLRDAGVTAIELMPVADFPGSRNWGYDGVLPFAPDSSYGRPEEIKQLVQAAHAQGLMILLDVVYNHFGPEGNYLRLYSPQFFTDRYHTPWGEAINFDGPENRVVRDFFIHNALYWLEEYNFDGLRLDAVHAIVDDSKPDILTELVEVVRERFPGDRHIHLILENGDNGARYLRRDQGRHAVLYNAQWNDDIHHASHVLITGESDGYYSDYTRQPVQQLGRCLAEGFAFQGEYSQFHGATRGEPSAGLPPCAFVSFLQNHDQVGNRAFGERILQLASPAAVRVALEILLLAPAPPLLFMGEEFGAKTPFLFFCDFQGDLARAVTEGRRDEFSRFAKFSTPEMRDHIPDPNAEATFLQSKLDWKSLEDESAKIWLRFYRELLSLRRRVIVPLLRGTIRGEFHAGKGRGLSVDWVLANGKRLQLSANLGPEEIALSMGHSGAPFYCSNHETTAAFEQGKLPPWSVVWSRARIS